MRVTVPIRVTDVMLVSSSVPEPYVAPAYVPGKTYSFGEIVSVAADFVMYESLVDNNTGHTPSMSADWWKRVGPTEQAYDHTATYVLRETVVSSATHRIYESQQAGNTGNALPVPPATQNDWWLDVGSTNRMAMFDLKGSKPTVDSTVITVSVAPGERINTLAIRGMESDDINVFAMNGGSVVYDFYQSLVQRLVLDQYMYHYAPFTMQPSVVLFDIPPFTDIVMTLTISRTTGNVKCGSWIMGTYAYLGDTKRESTSDALNFGQVDRDQWGDATLTPYRSVPKTSQELLLDKSKVNFVYALRAQLNGVPALYTALDDASDGYFEMLELFGFYTRFLITATSVGTALINLDVEGY